MIDLCTLGTGGTMPLHTRALASLYVRNGARALLVDCGEGTQVEIGRLGWGFLRIEALLLTHYHADHCSGLPGLLLALTKAGRTEPLHVWGPPDLRRVVTGLRVIAPQLGYEPVLHELPLSGGSFGAAGLRVRAFPLDHGMPCLGYRFDMDRPRAFLPERARALGIPLRAWSFLQRGETVIVDGRTWRPEQVLGEARRGISFVYATDTRPVPGIAAAGRGTQLMILEGMYGGEEDLPKALKNSHMLFRESAALAAQAGTERLLLTHFSTSLEEPEAFLDAARAVFPAADCARDGMTLTLGYPS
jgi:ribonuclease Z